VVLLTMAIALAGTGLGCTRARQAQSAASAAAQPTSSKETTQAIKAQIQSKIAQRAAVMGELKALDAQIAAGPGGSNPSTDGAKTQAGQTQRSVLAEQLDTLDAELEAEAERYNALQPSAPMTMP